MLFAYSHGIHLSQHSPGRVAATKSLPQLGTAQSRGLHPESENLF